MTNLTLQENITDSPMTFLETSVILFFSIALSIITIGGNLLVLCSFYLEPGLRVSSNYFIASLAVTDLLIGLFSMNLYTVYIVLGSWPLSQLMCDLWLSMDYTACLTSQYTVFLITVDRFCSIKLPMRYNKWRSDKVIFFMIFLTWFIPSVMFYSIIMSWPYIVGRQRGDDDCYAEFSIKPVFITILTICYFWITLVVMIGLYIGIYKVALTLQRKSDARKAKVNKYFLISLANRQTNQMLQKNKKEICSYYSKDDDIDSSSCKTIDFESESLRHSHSSCFILYSGQLPNIESPLLSEESTKHSKNNSPVCRGNQSFNHSTYFHNSLKYKTEEMHHHCYCNIHHNNAALFCLHHQSCCDIQGYQFIDVENLRSSFNINHTDFRDPEKSMKLCSSPIWKERIADPTKCKNDTAYPLNNTIEKTTSFTLKSPLQKVAKKFYGALQKNKDIQSNITQNRNRAKKALKTISFILGAFIICWTPFHVVILIKAACDDHSLKRSCMNNHLYRLAYWLCYINSPINPFCYALANTQIKEAFFRILSCKYIQR